MNRRPDDGRPRQRVTPGAKVRCLADLGVSEEERDALRRQGSIVAQRRGSGRVYYCLRFRCAGRQRSVYLGCDRESVAQIEKGLAELQGDRGRRRRLSELERKIRHGLRTAMKRLEPYLESEGYHLHGLAVRRRRSTNNGHVNHHPGGQDA